MFSIDHNVPFRDNFLSYPGTAYIDQDKLGWIREYSDDIFKYLKESEKNAKLVHFRSPQYEANRPQMLNMLRFAIEKFHLRRTTFHLATYLLDRFMDTYRARVEKLNLAVISSILLAAKIEEADINLPKFADLCKLVPETDYTMDDYRKVEVKLLNTVSFRVIHPTAATFAEYFLNGFITLDDYHQYTLSHQWNRRCNYVNPYYCCPGQSPWLEITQPLLPLYTSYDDMVFQLSTMLLSMIDISINYFQFANARPSIIASACIAAVRQMRNVLPVWTPYIIQLTGYTEDIVSPFVDALILLWKMNVNGNQYSQRTQQVQNSTLSESLDSGIVDTKSETRLNLDENTNEMESIDGNAEPGGDEGNENDLDDEDVYCCYEYPPLPKRRRLL